MGLAATADSADGSYTATSSCRVGSVQLSIIGLLRSRGAMAPSVASHLSKVWDGRLDLPAVGHRASLDLTGRRHHIGLAARPVIARDPMPRIG
jgi:hypothetical protein